MENFFLHRQLWMENFFYYSLCKQIAFEIDLGLKDLAFELIIELSTVSTQKKPHITPDPKWE